MFYVIIINKNNHTEVCLMSEIYVYDCLCQNCHIPFKNHAILHNCVNCDIKNTVFNDFMSLSLNEVSCPLCKTKFTYEIPMIVISLKHKFVIKVNPSAFHNPIPTKQLPPFRILPPGFRFREVYFMIEAVEKANIFLQGFEDVYIEHFKSLNFADDEALPFDEVNVVYTHSDDLFHYFVKYDSDNNPTEFFKKHKNSAEVDLNHFSDNKWYFINRVTIKNLLEKEN